MLKFSLFRKKKVLLIAEAEDILAIAIARLEQEGHDVLIVSDGLEGLKRLQKEKLDLIVVDISVPQVNGLQMVQLLRTSGSLKGTPIIVVTDSHSLGETACQSLKGVSQFLLKPFEVKELVEKVKATLSGPTPREKTKVA